METEVLDFFAGRGKILKSIDEGESEYSLLEQHNQEANERFEK